jgi:hypothetical protein
MGSVSNNSTWIPIGYRIYSLWRFTITEITTEIVASRFDASLGALTEED